MIILDTSIVRNHALTSAPLDLLTAIRVSGVEGVGAPWVVLEELVAQRTVPYKKRYDEARHALRYLANVSPWDIPQQMPPPRLEDFREHWRERFRIIFEVLPTSEQALRQGLQREMNELPPGEKLTPSNRGKEGEVKIGGRDAAIWLTAIEYAREHPEETVYFVSSNTKDFHHKDRLPYPMDQDLRGLEDRFVMLTSIQEVLTQFAQRTTSDEVSVTADLQQSINYEMVPLLASRKLHTGFTCTATPLSHDGSSLSPPMPVRATGWRSGPTVQFVSATDIETYRIGNHEWCMATTRWRLGGLAALRPPFHLGRAGFTWDIRFLFSTARPDVLTPLWTAPPAPLTDQEWDLLPGPPAPPGLSGPLNFDPDDTLVGLSRNRNDLEEFLDTLTHQPGPDHAP